MSYRIISTDNNCDLYINGKYCCSGTWVEVAKKFEGFKTKV